MSHQQLHPSTHGGSGSNTTQNNNSKEQGNGATERSLHQPQDSQISQLLSLPASNGTVNQSAPARKSNLIIRLDQLQESRQDNPSVAPHMYSRNGYGNCSNRVSKPGDEAGSNVAQKSNSKTAVSTRKRTEKLRKKQTQGAKQANSSRESKDGAPGDATGADNAESASEAHEAAQSINGDDVDDETHRGQMFDKGQTKLLQKWFIEHIHHPYVRKEDKAMLAQKTGLTRKQVTGWFTNNRKRKYQKALDVAKKRGRGLEFVKEYMIMKFDKDLEQGWSGSSDGGRQKTLTRKNGVVENSSLDSHVNDSDTNRRVDRGRVTGPLHELVSLDESQRASKHQRTDDRDPFCMQKALPLPRQKADGASQKSLKQHNSGGMQSDQSSVLQAAPGLTNVQIAHGKEQLENIVNLLENDQRQIKEDTSHRQSQLHQQTALKWASTLRRASIPDSSISGGTQQRDLRQFTFIPIIFTTNGPIDPKELVNSSPEQKGQILNMLKPLCPIKSQIESALKLYSHGRHGVEGSSHSSIPSRSQDKARETTPPPRVVKDVSSGELTSNKLSNDAAAFKTAERTMVTTKTRGASSQREGTSGAFSKEDKTGGFTEDHVVRKIQNIVQNQLLDLVQSQRVRQAAAENSYLQMSADQLAKQGSFPVGEEQDVDQGDQLYQQRHRLLTTKRVGEPQRELYTNSPAMKYSSRSDDEDKRSRSQRHMFNDQTQQKTTESNLNLSRLDPSKQPPPTFQLRQNEVAGPPQSLTQEIMPFKPPMSQQMMNQHEASALDKQIFSISRQLIQTIEQALQTNPDIISQNPQAVSQRQLMLSNLIDQHLKQNGLNPVESVNSNQTFPQQNLQQQQVQQLSRKQVMRPTRILQSARQPQQQSNSGEGTSDVALHSLANQPKSSTSMFAPSSNINSLTNALGMVFPGPVNVGYPSNYSVLPVEGGNGANNCSGSNGSNDSHGMNINSGSGSGGPIPQIAGGTGGSRSAHETNKQRTSNANSRGGSGGPGETGSAQSLMQQQAAPNTAVTTATAPGNQLHRQNCQNSNHHVQVQLQNKLVMLQPNQQHLPAHMVSQDLPAQQPNELNSSGLTLESILQLFGQHLQQPHEQLNFNQSIPESTHQMTGHLPSHVNVQQMTQVMHYNAQHQQQERQEASQISPPTASLRTGNRGADQSQQQFIQQMAEKQQDEGTYTQSPNSNANVLHMISEFVKDLTHQLGNDQGQQTRGPHHRMLPATGAMRDQNAQVTQLKSCMQQITSLVSARMKAQAGSARAGDADLMTGNGHIIEKQRQMHILQFQNGQGMQPVQDQDAAAIVQKQYHLIQQESMVSGNGLPFNQGRDLPSINTMGNGLAGMTDNSKDVSNQHMKNGVPQGRKVLAPGGSNIVEKVNNESQLRTFQFHVQSQQPLHNIMQQQQQFGGAEMEQQVAGLTQMQQGPTSAPTQQQQLDQHGVPYAAHNKFKMLNFVETTTFGNKSAAPSSQHSVRQGQGPGSGQFGGGLAPQFQQQACSINQLRNSNEQQDRGERQQNSAGATSRGRLSPVGSGDHDSLDMENVKAASSTPPPSKERQKFT